MTKNIGTDANIVRVRLNQQTSHPSAPVSGYNYLYIISGSAHGGLYLEDSAGRKIGPFITGSSPSSGGALILLEQHTASNSASLDFTTSISSTYDEYQIEFINLIPVTDNVAFWMRMSTDGGSTYDNGANYSDDHFLWRAGGAAPDGGAGHTQIVLNFSSGIDNSSNWGVTGEIRLFSPGSTSLYKQISGKLHIYDNAPFRTGQEVIGAYENATAVNAFQFLFSSGNISSGIIRVYGIAKS